MTATERFCPEWHLALRRSSVQPAEEATSEVVAALQSQGTTVLGPMVAPIFIDSLPPYGLFPFIGIASLALSGVGIYSLSSSAAAPIADQGHFVALPSHTAAVAYEIDQWRCCYNQVI